MRIKICILIATLTLSSNVLSNDVDEEVQAVMGWLDEADPKQDATESARLGDCHLMAVRGIVTYIPGVEGNTYRKYEKKLGVKVIEGTSDGLVSEEHQRLNIKARKYAEKYNSYILSSECAASL